MRFKGLRARSQPPPGPVLDGPGAVQRNDIRGFVRYAKRAVELAPDGDALGFLAFVLAEVGRISEARQNAEEALARDPLIFFSSFVLAAVDIFEDNSTRR